MGVICSSLDQPDGGQGYGQLLLCAAPHCWASGHCLVVSLATARAHRLQGCLQLSTATSNGTAWKPATLVRGACWSALLARTLLLRLGAQHLVHTCSWPAPFLQPPTYLRAWSSCTKSGEAMRDAAPGRPCTSASHGPPWAQLMHSIMHYAPTFAGIILARWAVHCTLL